MNERFIMRDRLRQGRICCIGRPQGRYVPQLWFVDPKPAQLQTDKRG